MKENNEFSNDFIFKYLILLSEYDYKDLFLEYYDKAKDYLVNLASKTKDIKVLKDLNSIFNYRAKLIEIKL